MTIIIEYIIEESLYTTLANLKERLDVWLLTVNRKTCLPELLGGGGRFYLGKRINKINYEGIGTCARITRSQATDSTDKK